MENELANGQLDKLRLILEDSSGKCPVTFHIHYPGKAYLDLLSSFHVTPNDTLLQQIEILFSRPDVARLI